MTSTTAPSEAEYLKAVRGIRFHHFHDLAGRLVATIATEPFSDTEIAVAAAVCAVGDSPSRALGRKIAVGRLEVGKCEIVSPEDLKAEITNRNILARFVTDKTAQRLGYDSVGDFICDLRPRLPFVPRKKKEVVEEEA
jgi:hypothetical protein